MIQIAVIGLSEAGKTVYLTSLINHLLRKNLEGVVPGLKLDGNQVSIKPGFFSNFFCKKALSPHLFPYEDNTDLLASDTPRWPDRTKDIYEYVLEIAYRRDHFKTAKTEPIRFLDYPGELIADFPMLSQTYSEWSNTIMGVLRRKQKIDWEQIFNTISEKPIGEIAERYFQVVTELEKKGFNYIQPSRYFDLKSMSELKDFEQFFPVLVTTDNKNDNLVRTLEKRFESYKHQTVRPAFDILKKCPYQIILFDVITTLVMGLDHYNDTSY